MKKFFYLILISILLFSCKKSPEHFKVGISKVVSHPSLNLVEEGIKDTLKDKNIAIDVKIANGELSTANLIANTFKSGNKSLVVGIGTMSAQALKSVNTKTPLVFAAVSDPKQAKLLAPNVTGTSDNLTCVDKQLDLLLKYFPNTKNIAIFYCGSELNSISQVETIENEASKRGLHILKGSATSSSEIPQVVSNLIKKADAIYIPTDNLMVSNISYLIDIAKKEKKPLITSENSSVKLGALFAYSVDYYELGKKTGLMILEIKNGKNPKDIPIEEATPHLYVNKDTEKYFGIEIKEEHQ